MTNQQLLITSLLLFIAPAQAGDYFLTNSQTVSASGTTPPQGFSIFRPSLSPSPSVSDVNLPKMTFVHMNNYLPAKDDDYRFKVVPDSRREKGPNTYYDAFESSRYQTFTEDGGRKSRFRYTLTTWELPPYVEAHRDYFVLHGRKNYAHKTWDIPSGRDGVAILELLEYWPGDTVDECGYAVRAFSVGRTFFVVGLLDFGRKNSRVTFRITYLTWPAEEAVEVDVQHVIAAHDGSGDATVGKRWIAAPTMYLTDTSRYQYGLFADKNNFLNMLSGESQADAEDVDFNGLIKSAGKVAVKVVNLDVGGIVETAANFIADTLKALDTKGDERDDDFSFSMESRELAGVPGGVSGQVSLSIADGNKYSLAEMTIWSLSFPSPYKSIEAYNYPNHYIRHHDFLGRLSRIGPRSSKLDVEDSSFLLAPGMADSKCISFESINYPQHYLRHKEYEIVLAQKVVSLDEHAEPRTDPLYAADATFCKRGGLVDSTNEELVSFESYNFPGYYLRHKNFELFLEKNDGTSAFGEDATFKIVESRSGRRSDPFYHR